MHKILVVDDAPDVRKTLEGLLKDAGYEVQSAANEGEALNLVMNTRFDLALIDVRLHGDDKEDESGLILTMAIRRVDPQIRIILMTGFPLKFSQVVRAIRYYGAVDFIEKTPDNYVEISKIVTKTISDPNYKRALDISQLNISLVSGQPIGVRAHGTHVYSARSWKVLRLNVERYARWADIALNDWKNLRFHIKETGSELWREIFDENQEVKMTFLDARSKGRSLKLLVEAPKDYLRLPLEFLHPNDDATSDYLILEYPLARFIYEAIPKREAISPALLAQKDKLRILIIASNTWQKSVLPRIKGVDIETTQLYDSLKQQDFVELKLIPTEQASWSRVQSELKNCRYDIIHYAGHGLHNPASPEESSIFFWTQENSRGAVKQVKATELQDLLKDSEVRLVYLSCCEGSKTGEKKVLLEDDFLGLADAIVHAGVPSVLGFRWPVSDKGACEMALEFYRSLLESGSPEIAIWQARRKLAGTNRDDPTWLSPILIHQQ